jgi:hypothetical protein
MPCGLVGRCKHFRGTFCLHLQLHHTYNPYGVAAQKTNIKSMLLWLFSAGLAGILQLSLFQVDRCKKVKLPHYMP